MKQIRLRLDPDHEDVLDEIVQDENGIKTQQAAICYLIENYKKEKSAFEAKIASIGKSVDELLELCAGSFADSGIEDLAVEGGERLLQQAQDRVDRKITRSMTVAGRYRR